MERFHVFCLGKTWSKVTEKYFSEFRKAAASLEDSLIFFFGRENKWDIPFVFVPGDQFLINIG